MKCVAAVILAGGMILSGGHENRVNGDYPQISNPGPSDHALSPLPTADVIESGGSREVKNLDRFQTFSSL